MRSSDTLLARSTALHERVRAFAHSALTADGDSHDTFESLAADIAAFQRDACEGHRRIASEGSVWMEVDASSVALHPVPADAFRFADVFSFSRSAAARSFLTSGTTSGARGVHHVRDLCTYSQLSVLLAKQLLLPKGVDQLMCLALMQDGGPHTSSSLGFMCQHFMNAFDARTLSCRTPGNNVCVEPERWLVDSGGVKVGELERAVAQANRDGEPILLLTTSFALVMLLDALGTRKLPLPPGSVVMPTGGFKGKTREISAEKLWQWVDAQLSPEFVVGEYGMTELSSQLYEGTLRDTNQARDTALFLEPPWLRVVPLLPDTLQPAVVGKPGLACFVDLANIDSAVAVLTQDMVRRESTGVRLLGRRAGAPLRGCSLAIEEVLGALP